MKQIIGFESVKVQMQLLANKNKSDRWAWEN